MYIFSNKTSSKNVGPIYLIVDKKFPAVRLRYNSMINEESYRSLKYNLYKFVNVLLSKQVLF